MSFSSKIDLSNLTKRNYSHCYLIRNPFPSTAIPEDIPLVTVDREQAIIHFKDVTRNLVLDNTSSLTVLVGGYGAGKSHLLKVFKNNINSQLLDEENGIIATYVRSPGKNFLELFLTLIDDFGREKLKRISNRLIKNYLIKEGMYNYNNFIKGKSIELKDDFNFQITDSFFDQIILYDFMSNFQKYYINDVRNSDLLYAIFMLAHPKFENLAWKWMLGESISSEEKKLLHISTNLDDQRIAYNLFKPFLGLLKKAGINGLVLLVDELEKILLINSMARSQYQDDLRHMIDDNTQGINIFFSITPTEYEKLVSEQTAFTRRLSGNTIRLDDFDNERITLLIKGYLEINRIEKYKQTEIVFDENTNKELYPFTNLSIDKIMEITRGRISSIILLCRKSLDYYIDFKDQCVLITPEVIEKVRKIEGF